jgi:hypothetical protein
MKHEVAKGCRTEGTAFAVKFRDMLSPAATVLRETRLSSLDGKESLDEGHGFSRAIKSCADEGFSP